MAEIDADVPSVPPEVLFEIRGGLGIVTLNRPKALNALSLGMIRRIDPQLREWRRDDAVRAVLIQGVGDRAFCAGGDVRAIVLLDAGPEREALQREFFAAEYTLNYLVHTFAKPYIAVMDGVTMGGGVGLAAHGSHRVATERTAFAMPEMAIGLFPDVGATRILNGCPGEIGIYLGLTGTRLGAVDLLALGIATHAVPGGDAAALIDDLAGAADLSHEGVGQVLARHHVDPGPSEILPLRPAIDRIFGAATVEAIRDALAAEPAPWAEKALEALGRGSPTSEKVALRQLRTGRGLAMAEILRIDYRLSQHFMASADFPEGVRSVLVDRDNAPRWRPDRLEAVDDATVEGYFAPIGDLELQLPD